MNQKDTTEIDPETLRPLVGSRMIEVNFTSTKVQGFPWIFRPMQKSVKVIPGQSCLTFFEAENTSEEKTKGVSSYNIVPSKAAPYFNKIQCFCFEEQELDGKEKVEMPILFYIDREFALDPTMDNVSNITLAYTLFEAE